MQIEALKIFCDVVRHRSFSRGGAENQVSQSRASQAVLDLERRLRVSLIDRSRRPFQITPQGKIYYEGLRDLLERHEALEGAVRSFEEEAASALRVGSIYSVGLRHMKEYIQHFSAENPRVKVHLEYLHPERIYEGVIQEDLDIGIVSFPESRREIAVIPWRDEPMVLACHPDHPRARAPQARPGELSGEKFVAFDRGLRIRREVDRFLKRHGAQVEVVLEFDNIEAIKRAVEISSGVSVLPRPTLDREVASGTLAAVPLTTRDFVRPLAIIRRRGRRPTTSAERFTGFLRETTNGNGKAGADT